MDQWLNTFNTWLMANPGWISIAILATAMLESLAIAGLAVPGVAMLFVIAVVAGNHDLSVWAAMGWACLGAVLGDGVSYWLGRHFQGRIHGLWPFTRYPQALDRGEAFFHAHGGKSVVLGRFIGPIRPIIPMVAGAFGMEARRFLTFNVLSALGWAPLYILPGFLVGASLASESDLPPHFYPILITGVALLGALLALFFRLHLGLLPRGQAYQALQAFFQRHPGSHRLWRALSRPRGQDREFPLPSLVLLVAATLCFGLWTLIIISTPWLDSFNALTVDFFGALRQPLLDPVFLVMTLSGDGAVLTAGAVLFSLILYRGGYPAAAWHILGATAATILLTAGFKYGLFLTRPETVDLPPATPAYPSGHTSGATVLYGLMAAFVAQEFSRGKRWQVYLVGAVPILLIVLSRLYLGVHWFSDTVGGLLLGLAICGATRCSYSRYDRKPLSLGAPLLLTLLAWVLLLALYIFWRWPEAIQRYTPLAA